MRPSSPEFGAAIVRSHAVAAEAIVLRSGTPVGDPLTIVEGSVTLDATAAIRGRTDMTIVDPGLVPVDAWDLLAPYGNEVQVKRGIVHVDGRREMISLGIFQIESADVDDSGSGLTIKITGLDRSTRVQAARFQEPGTIYEDGPTADVIASLVSAVNSSWPTRVAQSAHRTTESVWLAGDDRWDLCLQLAKAAGLRVYFDGDGALFVGAEALSITPVTEIAEGENGVLLSVQRNWSNVGAFNAVVATGENTSLPEPVTGRAIDDNPLSPTYYYGPFGQRPRFYSSPLIATDEQAADAAAALLARELGTSEKVTFTSIVDPRLEPGDCIRIRRQRAGIDEDHHIDSVTIPLGSGETMRASSRAVQVRQ